MANNQVNFIVDIIRPFDASTDLGAPRWPYGSRTDLCFDKASDAVVYARFLHESGHLVEILEVKPLVDRSRSE